MKDLQMNKVRMSEIKKDLAPNFWSTFKKLLDVRTIEERKKRAKAESASSQAVLQGDRGRKRSPPSPLSIQPAKRVHGGDDGEIVGASTPKTPDRPTKAANPDLSHETVESGISIQSKDEESTKLLGNTFIQDSMALLGEPFQEIHWSKSGRAIQLTSSLFS